MFTLSLVLSKFAQALGLVARKCDIPPALYAGQNVEDAIITLTFLLPAQKPGCSGWIDSAYLHV